MSHLVLVIQIIIAVLLVGSILIQSRGTGLGSAWGGGGEQYRSKRGMEKIIFIATIILAGIFLLISIISTILG
ncbi:MAG TPA: preprotein translocase subunit SecG [Candidatus Bathyarchaeia archaeon]|nr:preprotein translocase subunit SecG [Candidatus Bathyarchaeia archaeon]